MVTQAVPCIPATTIPLLTRDTIDARVAELRAPTSAPELAYRPAGWEGRPPPEVGPCRVAPQRYAGMAPGSFRYMWDPPERRRTVLNARLARIGELIQRHHQLPDFVPLTEIAQEERVFLATVQSCSTEPSGAVTCVVDGWWTPEVSYGAGVTLRLEDVSSCTLFPGKIFAFRGKNIGGVRGDGSPTIIVSEVYEAPALPVAAGSSAERMEVDGTLTTRMVVACGPFAQNQGRAIQQIQEIVYFAARQRHAACVLLCGPFVEAPPDGAVPDGMDFDQMFDATCEKLSKLCEDHPGLKLLIVPSLRDLAADFVFPQPAFDVAFDSDRVVSLGNPATFTLNDDAPIAVSSAPILEHLGRSLVELRPDTSVNRVLRMARQLLHAQSVYPLLPPPADVPLSLDHYAHCEFGGRSPAVLILPCCLLPFAHKVGETLVINPGLVTKRSFAELTIAPFDPANPTPVADRAAVDFLRLPPPKRAGP